GHLGQAQTFNGIEVPANQFIAGICDNHRATAVANNSKRLRIQAAHVGIIASHHCSNGGVEVLDRRPLQILRLKSLAAPASSCCSVKSESTANPGITAGARPQCIDFFYSSLSPAEAELENAQHLRGQVRVEQQFLNCFAIKCLGRAALCCKPLLQALNLVDAGDSAAGDRSELGIDLGPSSL